MFPFLSLFFYFEPSLSPLVCWIFCSFLVFNGLYTDTLFAFFVVFNRFPHLSLLLSSHFFFGFFSFIVLLLVVFCGLLQIFFRFFVSFLLAYFRIFLLLLLSSFFIFVFLVIIVFLVVILFAKFSLWLFNPVFLVAFFTHFCFLDPFCSHFLFPFLSFLDAFFVTFI